MFWLLLSLGSAWAAAALWVQFPAGRIPALTGLALAVAVVIWLRLGPGSAAGWSPGGWTGLSLLMAALLAWYFSLTPRQDRDWAPDVAHIVRGEVEGNLVHLENIRNFRWKTADEAEEAWISRSVDLTKIEGIDMITSSWGNPNIAHLLVSFRFSGEDPLTFSVEIRRERGEKFSALGGFFRQFELSLIAADEADIVKWRAVPRAEEVRLYPLNLTEAQQIQIFLLYLELGNELNRRPSWYNTVTSNCASVVWKLVRVMVPDLPLDRSLLLPGFLPDYLDRFGALAGNGTLEDKRARALISPKARAMPEGADFSAWIRQ